MPMSLTAWVKYSPLFFPFFYTKKELPSLGNINGNWDISAVGVEQIGSN